MGARRVLTQDRVRAALGSVPPRSSLVLVSVGQGRASRGLRQTAICTGPAQPGAVRSRFCYGSCQGVTNGLSVAIRAAAFHLLAIPLLLRAAPSSSPAVWLVSGAPPEVGHQAGVGASGPCCQPSPGPGSGSHWGVSPGAPPPAAFSPSLSPARPNRAPLRALAWKVPSTPVRSA